MSFIHCSPLFTPLMPLPTMSSEVMRKEGNKTTSSMKTSAKGAMKPPATKRKTSTTSAKSKGKQPALSPHRASHSPSQMTASAGPSHPYQFQPPYLPHLTAPYDEVASANGPEHEMDTNPHLPYSEHTDERPDLFHSSSYKEGSYESDVQAALTFTVESQPMSDLSSSQQ